MANKRRSHDEEAWTSAKKIYRLTARQVEMARRLGMNPTPVLIADEAVLDCRQKQRICADVLNGLPAVAGREHSLEMPAWSSVGAYGRLPVMDAVKLDFWITEAGGR